MKKQAYKTKTKKVERNFYGETELRNLRSDQNMKPIFKKLDDYKFNARLNDLVVRINNDSRRHINKDLADIKACAEGAVELVLLQEKINKCTLRATDIQAALNEAAWSFRFIKNKQLVETWQIELKSLSELHLQILFEETPEAQKYVN